MDQICKNEIRATLEPKLYGGRATKKLDGRQLCKQNMEDSIIFAKMRSGETLEPKHWPIFPFYEETARNRVENYSNMFVVILSRLFLTVPACLCK